MSKRKTGNRYDQDFKQMIVDLYNSTDSTYADLEGEYGVTSATIQRWVKQLTPVKISDDESMSLKELKQIQKEMAKLREENEILKKAMAILVKK